jgi:hypothetical protein
MNVLVMNPGSNSLKVEVISCSPTQRFASEGRKLVSLILEGMAMRHACLFCKARRRRTLSRSRRRIMVKRPAAFSIGLKKKNTLFSITDVEVSSQAAVRPCRHIQSGACRRQYRLRFPCDKTTLPITNRHKAFLAETPLPSLPANDLVFHPEIGQRLFQRSLHVLRKRTPDSWQAIQIAPKVRRRLETVDSQLA